MKQLHSNTLQGRQWLAALLLLATVAPGVQAQETLSLSDNADNSTAISTANGQECNVTLSGRTIYRDNEWNTLCLPFDMTAAQITASPLADATIMALDGSGSSLDGSGKLTLKFASSSTITAGTPYLVKWPVTVISSDTKWDALITDMTENSKTYEGKVVRLAADINIGSGDMLGSADVPFKGIFDGAGHTLNCDIDASTTYYVAPFHYIQGATIMNVKVTGTVTGGKHCAGLVGIADGTDNVIQNCEVAATVTSTGTHCGGVLGHGMSSTTTMENCLFSGTIISSSTTNVGILYGWANPAGHSRINSCLANGTYSATGTIDVALANGSTQTITNCFKTKEVGTAGTYTTASGAELAASLGAANWTTSGDKAVPKMSVGDVADPTFNGVTIDGTLRDASFSGVTFKGNYDPLAITDANRHQILLLSSGNRLGYAKTDRTLGAFRAYFLIPDAAAVSSFELDFSDASDWTTGVRQIDNGQRTMDNGQWYDLQGRRVNGQKAKGLYIVNGRKVVVK